MRSVVRLKKGRRGIIFHLGNKKDNQTVIYTPWSNLHKDDSMAVGQVGFSDQKQVQDVFFLSSYFFFCAISASVRLNSLPPFQTITKRKHLSGSRIPKRWEKVACQQCHMSLLCRKKFFFPEGPHGLTFTGSDGCFLFPSYFFLTSLFVYGALEAWGYANILMCVYI